MKVTKENGSIVIDGENLTNVYTNENGSYISVIGFEDERVLFKNINVLASEKAFGKMFTMPVWGDVFYIGKDKFGVEIYWSEDKKCILSKK